MKPLEVLKVPRLKLAGTYLLIIMVMSLVFSFAIYNISSRELKNQRQLQIPRDLPIEYADEFNRLRELRYLEAKENLRGRLIVFNVFVLVFGTILSYALAIRALQPIEEALEAQNRFSSDASHEMRTPLTVMKSEIEVALRDKKLSSKDARDILESNLEEVKKLEALTNGLLQLARHESKDISKQMVNIDQIINNAVDQIRPVAKIKKIKLNKSKIQSFQSRCEPHTLTQAIITILDNAIKYSPSGSTVFLETKIGRMSHNIIIRDQGEGIEKHDLLKIFDRFYRADKSRTRSGNQNGYGLGLAIAKQIIQAHSGDISISSKKNEGTTVVISLPKK